MKKIKYEVTIIMPKCDSLGNGEEYLQELIQDDFDIEDKGRWKVEVKELEKKMTKEEIRQAAQKEFAHQIEIGSKAPLSVQEGFINGAEWMQCKMIEKVAKWLRKNIDEDVSVPCGNVIKIISVDEFVEYFTKSMEEEK